MIFLACRFIGIRKYNKELEKFPVETTLIDNSVITGGWKKRDRFWDHTIKVDGSMHAGSGHDVTALYI